MHVFRSVSSIFPLGQMHLIEVQSQKTAFSLSGSVKQNGLLTSPNADFVLQGDMHGSAGWPSESHVVF